MVAILGCFSPQGLIGDAGDSLEPDHLERLYVYALMWSLGSLLELGDRDRMEEHIRKHIGKDDFGQLSLPVIPEGSSHTMFEYRVNDDGKSPRAVLNRFSCNFIAHFVLLSICSSLSKTISF